MSLEDLGIAYNWFEKAKGKITGNSDGGVDIEKNDFGEGKTNSTKWIEKWNSGDYEKRWK